jgi:MSHA biogenesis protein MshM
VDQHHLLKALTLGLLDFARSGRRVVLCLDEVQAMPLETLEALRLLTNLETEKRKLLQIVLFGQPELDDRLEQESVRQLRQRITFHYRLGALRSGELDDYVAHRLAMAGYRGGPLFSQGALRRLYRASGGVPRLVNILAHKALLLTYGEGGAQAEARHVRAAVADTPAARQLRWWHRVLGRG